jgi:glutamine amidotransferase-like uncharacterized protein
MKPTIAIFLHQPKASIQSGNGILKALGDYYNFKMFTKHELEDDFFDDVDCVAMPGGIGDSDSYEYIQRVNGRRIRNFVARGGKYLGICMGAYWADADYFNILHNVRVVQYIKQKNACTRRPHAKYMPVRWKRYNTHMYFYDGCTYTGSGHYDTWAKYSNGDPMAIMQNTVGLIGCHPEAEHHWYQEYSWMRRHWDGGKHELLLDFVNELMKR